MNDHAFLEAAGVSKTYGGTRALDGMTFTVRRGEIHGLLGANGSGKSTFVKILAGVVAADPGGRIRAGRVDVPAERFTDPQVARSAGIRFVHQDPCVFPGLTVAENLAIGSGFATGRGGRIRWPAVRAHAASVLDRFGIDVDPSAPVATLRAADRAMVAIARALQDVEEGDGNLLVLDEPTAALPEPDVALLFERLRWFAAAGQTIVLVNHRLREVLDVADRATVLRDGRTVATADVADLDEATLAELIVGAPVTTLLRRSGPAPYGPAILETDCLVGRVVDHVSLCVREGEIVGVAGLRGDGQEELLRLLFGVEARRDGEVRVRGADVHFRGPADAMDAGVAYVPGDRGEEGVFPDQSVLVNLSATVVRRYRRWLGIDDGAARSDAEDLVEAFGVRLRSLDQPVSTLSGGNQQKVVFARWLRRRPALLLLDEPGQGVDVGAHREIEALVRQVVADGSAALVVSSDLGELDRLCDRVLIMRNGRIVDELIRPFDERELTRRTMLAAAS